MKNKLFIYTSLFVVGLLTGCDQGFDELNVNQTAATELNPVYEMNNAIVRATFPNQTIMYETAIVQQMVTPNGGVLAGGNFNQDNRTQTPGNWNRYYRESMKHVVSVLDKTREDAGRANLYHMARIWRAYVTMILTDSYGDIPYTEAGQGYLQENIAPIYSAQQEIYADMLKELDEASAALDPAGTIETGEVMYTGDIAKWKKLGYSLMLRAAMRLTKADPATAQTYVTKAVAGGVMQSNDDNCVIRHTTLYTNDIGSYVNGSEANNFYLTANFVNYLKANRDPRLASIAIRYVGAQSGAQQVAARAVRDTTAQIGMPVGYDNGSIGAVAQSSGLASFYDYSQLDRTRMGKIDAPAFLVTYAQTQLLLAEAAFRGWIVGNASDYFTAGVRAHLQQMGSYDVNSAIPTDAVDAYVLAHPLEQGSELEQINTQYWMASFLNGPEAFANFRRSGFPALVPNPYPGKAITGQFIRRLTYPDAEFSVNSGNVQQAIARQGPDNLDTRVWWDK